jgi:hypothetical protein
MADRVSICVISFFRTDAMSIWRSLAAAAGPSGVAAGARLENNFGSPEPTGFSGVL